jgi:dihydropyrimidinase
MDLAIRNGTVVTAAGTFAADVGVCDGRIVQVGGDVAAAAREVDATGRLVLPGCVDIHVHLASFRGVPPIDDFEHGTRAALAGGVTTVCDFAHQDDGGSLLAALEGVKAEAGAKSLIDFTFHAVLRDPTPAAIDEIPAVAAAGAGLKLFMNAPRFNRRVDDFVRGLWTAGRAGVLTAIHCEDHTICAVETDALLAAGKTGPEYYPASRPVLAEEIAVRRAIGFAETVGAPVYLVHLSSAAAVAAVTEARARGLPVYGETRPIYLYLTDAEYARPNREGGIFIGQPPLRGASDVTALWDALRAGQLHTVCTDHIPYPKAEKTDPARDFSRLPPGMSNLETLLPMLFSEGVRAGRISLPRLVELVSTNPARLAGLYPRKGAIAPGADADLVVFDPERARTIHAPEMYSAADHDIFEGWRVTGWPDLTIGRGEILFERGEVRARPGRGQFVPRARFQPL